MRPARRLLRKVSWTCKERRGISIAGSRLLHVFKHRADSSWLYFFSFPCTYHSGRIFRTYRSSKPVVYVWEDFTLSNVKSDLRNLKPLSYKSYCFFVRSELHLKPPTSLSMLNTLRAVQFPPVKSPTSGEEWGYLISCDEAFEVT